MKNGLDLIIMAVAAFALGFGFGTSIEDRTSKKHETKYVIFYDGTMLSLTEDEVFKVQEFKRQLISKRLWEQEINASK